MNDAPVRAILENTSAHQATEPSRNPVWAFWIASFAALLGAGAMGLAYFRQRRSGNAPENGAPPVSVHLTPREREVLDLVSQGLTTKAIARELQISPKTVEFHRGHLMQKFEARNMAELVHLAVTAKT